MALREKVGVAGVTAATVTGLLVTFQPPATDPGQREVQQRQTQVEQLGDAQEREGERMRADGRLHGEAEITRELTPVEPRPKVPRVPFRLP